jgi:hypothetical protein
MFMDEVRASRFCLTFFSYPDWVWTTYQRPERS